MYQVLRKETEWNACLSKAGLQTVFLARDFSRLCFSDPVLFVYRQGPNVAAFVHSRDKFTVKGLRYGGVITNSSDSSFGLDASRSLKDYLYAQGGVKCQIRNHPFLNTIKVGTLFKEEPFVFIDLTDPAEKLVADITKQHRRCIRKAQESGLNVLYSDNIKYLRVFYDLYKARQEMIGIQPKEYIFFEQIFGVLKKHLIISVVKDANKIIAVSLLLNDLGNIFMTYGGMSEEGYERCAKHLMISDMISSFSSKGFIRLILGTGSNGEDSIYDFKQAFTKRQSTICTYQIE